MKERINLRMDGQLKRDLKRLRNTCAEQRTKHWEELNVGRVNYHTKGV